MPTDQAHQARTGRARRPDADAPEHNDAEDRAGDTPFVVSSIVRRGPEIRTSRRFTVTLSARPDDSEPDVADGSTLFDDLADPEHAGVDIPEPADAPVARPTPIAPTVDQPRPRPRPDAVATRPPGSRPRPRPRPAAAAPVSPQHPPSQPPQAATPPIGASHPYQESLPPPTLPVPPRRPVTPPPPDRRRTGRSRRRWPAALALAALVLSVGIPLLVNALLGDDDQASPPPPPAAPTSTARSTPPAVLDVRTSIAAWARSALAPDSVVVTDVVTERALRSAGFTAVRGFGHKTDHPVRDADYVIDVAGAHVANAERRRTLLGHSRPLAVFGPADGPSTVREVFTGDAAAADTERTDAIGVARDGGRELLGNPAVVPDPAARSALLRGTLDLRIETVLTDLATTDTVRVGDPLQDPAETRAGTPVRSVVVTTTDPKATTAALRAVQAPYRPDSVHPAGSDGLRLTWRPALIPVDVAGG